MANVYYIALGLSFAASFLLGSRLHSLALLGWAVMAYSLDAASAYEMKLFLDFFGFHALLVLTLGNISKGRYSKAETLCATFGFLQIVASSLFWGASVVGGWLNLSSEVFNVLTISYGWTLSLLFLLSVLALTWGSNVRARIGNLMRGLRRLDVRRAGLPSAHEAWGRLFGGRERSA